MATEESHAGQEQLLNSQTWWVNQGNTFQKERDGGFLWAPQKDKRDGTPYHWENVALVHPGDLILHYAKGNLVAVSKAHSAAIEARKPEGLGGDYQELGWLVRCKYHQLQVPVPLSAINRLPSVLNVERGPLTATGTVKQGYLFKLTAQAFHSIATASNTVWPSFASVTTQDSFFNPREEEQARLVKSVDEVAGNVRRFHHETNAKESLPIATGRYFAFDPVSGWFAPAKFAGIAEMSVSLYQYYSRNDSPSIFDGNRTQNALRTVCGGSCSNAGVLRRFKEWLQKFEIAYKGTMEVFCAGSVEEPPVLETFCKEIGSVNTDRSSGVARKHKPLVLLAAVRTLAEGKSLGYEGPLRDNFRAFARAIGSNENFLDPYFRLTRDGLWEVVKDGAPLVFNYTPNGSDLKGTKARFKGKRQECVLDQYLRPYVIEAIASHFSYDELANLRQEWPEMDTGGVLSGEKGTPPYSEPDPKWWIMKIAPSSPRETGEYFRVLFGDGRANVIGMNYGESDLASTYCRWFENVMKPGDKVVIVEGLNRVHGVVEVDGEHSVLASDETDPSSDWFEHRRPVKLIWQPDSPFNTVAQTNNNPLIPANEGGLGKNAPGSQGIVNEVKRRMEAPAHQHSHLTYPMPPMPTWNWDTAMHQLVQGIANTGFYFEPWQVATFVTALRTKPFVILAGISGTGKSKLPSLLADVVGCKCELIPVRPDWTDSGDLLGYTDLQGTFHPGPFLRLAAEAEANPDQTYIALLDEMNLARVEHYFAEVLSRIEERKIDGDSWRCLPLLAHLNGGSELSAKWARVGLPPNLTLVGTVNMDESTHSFSRKVLDRAFTLELSDVSLGNWGPVDASSANVTPWPAALFIPWATSLAQVDRSDSNQVAAVTAIIRTLEELNKALQPAQLQVGYRVRDEIALFVLNAEQVKRSFVTAAKETVDPVDIAIAMKVLPRIIGGSGAVRNALRLVLAWAYGKSNLSDRDADSLLEEWQAASRPSHLPEAAYPRCAARACLMWERLRDDGFTSYWL